MVCVSLGKVSFEECRRVLGLVEMAELRLDLLNFSSDQLKKIFSSHPNLIAAFRSRKSGEQKGKVFLLEAINSGARFIDLDIETDAGFVSEVKKALKEKGGQLIVSYHNFRKTPEARELRHIIKRAFSRGADIAKVACFCRKPGDNARLLGILSENRPVVVCGMGPSGTITRVASVLCGSPFTYAYWQGKKPTAPGQLSYQQLKRIHQLLSSVKGKPWDWAPKNRKEAKMKFLNQA